MTSACGKGTERILIKHNYTTTDISYNVVWFGILYIVGTKGFSIHYIAFNSLHRRYVTQDVSIPISDFYVA